VPAGLERQRDLVVVADVAHLAVLGKESYRSRTLPALAKSLLPERVPAPPFQ
jgi:hypothetical protein